MSKARIRLFVKQNTKVGHRHIISGKTKGNMEVNAYILANDGLYYLQPPAVWHGNKFSIECTFGFEELSDDFLGYEAICVASSERPHSPVNELPAGECVSVRVWREKD